jgi:hypothetical protein
MLKNTLIVIAAALILYGIVVTVLPARVWTPFSATLSCPRIGWAGVFGISIVFDLVAAGLAFFVLKRMKAPVLSEVSERVVQPVISVQRA